MALALALGMNVADGEGVVSLRRVCRHIGVIVYSYRLIHYEGYRIASSQTRSQGIDGEILWLYPLSWIAPGSSAPGISSCAMIVV
jgi:hypothetical protein